MVKVEKKEVANKTTFKLSNWSKRTPCFWRKLGNTCIYALPLLQGAMMKSPLEGDTRMWVDFILTAVLVGIKAFTKFFTVEDICNDQKGI